MNHFSPEDFVDFQIVPPPRPGGGPGSRPPGRPGGPPPGRPGGPPRSGPPNYIPPRQITPLRVDAFSMRNCIGRFTYIWMSNGDEFWMFPIQVSQSTVTGFRWNPRFGWNFVGISLNRIDAFMCV